MQRMRNDSTIYTQNGALSKNNPAADAADRVCGDPGWRLVVNIAHSRKFHE
jgi:hypothetical protein